MNEDIKKKWVTALRSGEYKQGRGALRSINYDHSTGTPVEYTEFCCLGVLCELAVKEGVIPLPVISLGGSVYKYGAELEAGFLPIEVMKWANLPSKHGEQNITIKYDNGQEKVFDLTQHNDSGIDFDKISTAIETQL